MELSDLSLPVNLAVIRRSGEIAYVNEAWKRFAHRNGLQTPRFGLGSNYLDHCGPARRDTTEAVEQIRALLNGDVHLVSFPYRCDSPTRKRAFVLIGARLSEAESVLLHLNVSRLLGRLSAVETAKAVELSTSLVLASHLPRVLELTPGASERAPLLTKKEWEVLNLLGKGKTNKEIAALLSRSPNTIKIHISQIFKKLNVRSRTEAALKKFEFRHPD